MEADETYIGGKEGSKDANKKLRAGRGTIGKTPVAGIKNRPTDQVRTEVVVSTNRAMLQDFVIRHTEEGATVYTDEAAATGACPCRTKR